MYKSAYIVIKNGRNFTLQDIIGLESAWNNQWSSERIPTQ
jgi:hypothetical protein